MKTEAETGEAGSTRRGTPALLADNGAARSQEGPSPLPRALSEHDAANARSQTARLWNLLGQCPVSDRPPLEPGQSTLLAF